MAAGLAIGLAQLMRNAGVPLSTRRRNETVAETRHRLMSNVDTFRRLIAALL